MNGVWGVQDTRGRTMRQFIALAPPQRSLERKNVREQNGKWALVSDESKGAVICQSDPANRNDCWQPETGVMHRAKYTGRISVTKSGYKCAAWNDQSVHRNHKYLQQERRILNKKTLVKNFLFFIANFLSKARIAQLLPVSRLSDRKNGSVVLHDEQGQTMGSL